MTKFLAIHMGHIEVGDDKVEIAGRSGERFERGGGGIAAANLHFYDAREHEARDLEEVEIVIHDEAAVRFHGVKLRRASLSAGEGGELF